jgi:hypothetical protein
MDFRTSQSDFTTPASLTGRLDLDSIRNSTKSLAASLDLETRLHGDAPLARPPSAAGRNFTPSSTRDIPPPAAAPVPTVAAKTTPPRPAPVGLPSVAAGYGKMALDANQNATPTVLPSGAPLTKARTRQPDPMVEIFPKASSLEF